jgi:hypothetical protein
MTPVASQYIPNTHQWTNLEVMFFTRSDRQQRDATEELLGEMFSLLSASSCYKLEKPRVYLFWGQSPSGKNASNETEDIVGIVTGQRLVKRQQTEKI